MATDPRIKFPQLYDEAWLRRKYLDDGLSGGAIAAEIGCSRSRVEQRLHDLAIPLRGRWYGNWQPKTCSRCGDEYTPSGPAQRFCSQRCLRGARDCANCGAEFLLSTANRANLYCSRHCAYEHKKAQGKQGRYVNRDGYVRLSVPAGTVGRQGDGRMLEHRFVMQEHLGRPLARDEDVHHVNGDKTDNRIENLELWVRSQPRGQRATDLLDWARAVVARYETEEQLLLH